MRGGSQLSLLPPQRGVWAGAPLPRRHHAKSQNLGPTCTARSADGAAVGSRLGRGWLTWTLPSLHAARRWGRAGSRGSRLFPRLYEHGGVGRTLPSSGQCQGKVPGQGTVTVCQRSSPQAEVTKKEEKRAREPTLQAFVCLGWASSGRPASQRAPARIPRWPSAGRAGTA